MTIIPRENDCQTPLKEVLSVSVQGFQKFRSSKPFMRPPFQEIQRKMPFEIGKPMYSFTVPVSVLTRFLASLLAFTRRCVLRIHSKQMRWAEESVVKDWANRGFENSISSKGALHFLKTSTKNTDQTLDKDRWSFEGRSFWRRPKRLKLSSCDSFLWSPAKPRQKKWRKALTTSQAQRGPRVACLRPRLLSTSPLLHVRRKLGYDESVAVFLDHFREPSAGFNWTSLFCSSLLFWTLGTVYSIRTDKGIGTVSPIVQPDRILFYVL